MSEHAISTDLLPPRLPVLGHIKIGGKQPQATTSEGGKSFQPPVKFDHFRITTRTRGDDGNFVIDRGIHDVLGDKPTELDVRLPFDTRAQNLYAQMLQYDKRVRVRECNGEEYTDPRTHVSAVCDRAKGQQCKCKPYARLSVILEAAPTFGGVYVYRTTSWEATSSMQTVLRMLEKELGSLRGLPMKMQLQPAEVHYKDGQGKERTGTAYRVALVLRASFDEARAAMVEYHRTNQIARREVLQIAGATTEDLDVLDREDEGHIADEYFPEPPASEDDQESGSKLGEINRELGEHAGDESERSVDELIAEMRSLIKDAPEQGLGLTEAQLSSLNAAMDVRDEGHLRTGIDWLKTHIAKRQEATDA